MIDLSSLNCGLNSLLSKIKIHSSNYIRHHLIIQNSHVKVHVFMSVWFFYALMALFSFATLFDQLTLLAA